MNKGFFTIILAYFAYSPFLLILTPIYYFDKIYKNKIMFSNIPIYLKIIFLILYILLYIFSSKKHKKYVLISFIILYLCFAFFVVPEYIVKDWK